MNIDSRIKSFVTLGNFLKQFSKDGVRQNDNELNALFYNDFEELIKKVNIYNPWFVEENVRIAIAAITDSLNEEDLVEWISKYINQLSVNKEPKKVAVIMAGNIPIVGFHDMLCVLLSGNKFVGKLSSDDKYLLPFVAKVLIAIILISFC